MDAGRLRAVVRAHLRARDARRARRARRPGHGRGASWRAVRDAHARRDGRGLRFARRGRSRRSVPRSTPAPGARLQVSHLKCGSARGLGPGRRGGRRARGGPGGRSRRGGRPVPVHGGRDDPRDHPPAGAPRARRRCLRRGPRRPRGPRARPRGDRRAASRAGRTWRRTPAGTGIRISYAASHPDWSGRTRWRSSARRSARIRPTSPSTPWSTTGSTSSIVIHCMAEADVETIMAVPWIAVCTDATAGVRATPCSMPAGRTRGPTGARPACSGRMSASEGRSRSRQRSRSCPRSRPPGSACATAASSARGRSRTSWSSTPATVADVATYAAPAGTRRHRPRRRQRRLAVRDGVETGERAGRLLRHG